MKHTWRRTQPTLDLDASGLERVLQPHFPNACVAGFRQVATGLMNTIYRVELVGRDQPLCLKLGQRGPRSAAVEYAVSRALHAQFPIPEPYACAPSNPVNGHPYAISAWAGGERLDVLSSGLNGTTAKSVTEALGTLLARLHRHRFERTGLLDVANDGKLEVGTPFRLDGASLREHVTETLLRGPGGARLGKHLTGRLLDWLTEHGGRLDAVADDAVLCHSDFGAENILLEEESQLDGDEAGRDPHSPKLWVLDWEFACAGTRYLDLGHLLRTPLSTTRVFEQELSAAYQMAGGTLVEDWAELARLADLFAWLTFLGRETLPNEVADAAIRHIEHLMATT